MTFETQNIPVAIDTRMLGQHGTGVATYAQALHDAINACAVEPFHVVDRTRGQALRSSGHIERWYRWCDAWFDRPRHLARRARTFWARDIFRLGQVHFDRHGSLLELNVEGPPGIVHWTYPLPVRLTGWINVYTVHDAIPLKAPHLTPIDGHRHRALLEAIIAGGGRIMTVSDAARCDITEALGCAETSVSTCLSGLSVTADQPDALPEGLKPQAFFLAVGSIEPRKNLSRLVNAYRTSQVQHPLVIAGPRGWQCEAIEELISSTPGVVRLPSASRDELLALLAAARALLFPSLAEGFGLPIVEAMALGTPVLTSQTAATSEIAGGAALLVDPESTADIQAGIRRLSADDALLSRLSAAGRERARSFTVEAFGVRLRSFHSRLLEDEGWINR
jgi:glycosyltransferase involved in cell wall biosynthesis